MKSDCRVWNCVNCNSVNSFNCISAGTLLIVTLLFFNLKGYYFNIYDIYFKYRINRFYILCVFAIFMYYYT